jgi:hypothetical protein
MQQDTDRGKNAATLPDHLNVTTLLQKALGYKDRGHAKASHDQPDETQHAIGLLCCFQHGLFHQAWKGRQKKSLNCQNKPDGHRKIAHIRDITAL